MGLDLSVDETNTCRYHDEPNLFSWILISRYEQYVDAKYKDHLKNQGKAEAVNNISFIFIESFVSAQMFEKTSGWTVCSLYIDHSEVSWWNGE